jgi:ankyrin repeat protein
MNTHKGRAEAILADAIELTDPAARRAHLEGACAGDKTLRREIESLLAAHEQASEFMRTAARPGSAHVLPGEKAGDRIGRYTLIEQLGEGGFGVVWMAAQEEPVRRRVALKIIKLGMDTKEVVARFEAERQALALMDHPNIAKVFDGGATDTGRPYFVMELVKGIPITDHSDAARLPTAERLRLFIQVCLAVQHAHQKGVIHRDLKPSNVLVTMQDDRPVPKVIDFGVAKATAVRLTEKTLFTRFNQWIGTPAYMSPEQAGLGSLDVDTRSDVYSLGVLLYELLTGRPPFDTQKLLAAGCDAVMRTIREQEPPKPSTRLSALAVEELSGVATRRGVEPAKLHRLVRGDLDWIVMKALEKDRTRRYETTSALSLDIERHLRSEPVAAAAPGFRYRTGKFMLRNRTQLAFGAAACLVIGLAVVGGKLAFSYRSANKDFLATGASAVFTLARSDDAKALARLLAAKPQLVDEHDADGSSPLSYAAGAGATHTLQLLMARGATVDATNHTGATALGNAAANNQPVILGLLLEAGADPNHADASGATPLQSASLYGSVEMGRALLAKGARPEAAGPIVRITALTQAALLGYADFVELLLAHGARVDVRDIGGTTPLHAAASGQTAAGIIRDQTQQLAPRAGRESGNPALATAMQAESNRLARFEGMLAPAMQRSGGNHRRVAELLLGHQADVEATNMAGCTPLWIATGFTNRPVAEVLIAHRANLNARGGDGVTPLNLAARNGSTNLASLLIDAGADVNLPDGAGFTPLHTAIENRHRLVAELLLRHGADPNRAGIDGKTPLHTAAANGVVESMRLLLDKGAYVHALSTGGTPLGSAIESGQRAAVELLLQQGANPNLTAGQGLAPLHFATLLGRPVLVDLLLQSGASNGPVCSQGTPLHLAAGGRTAAQQWLSGATNRAPPGWLMQPASLGTDADYHTVLSRLLASGANVAAQAPGLLDRTPLFSAVVAGNTAAVETLLAAGADGSARDSAGTTPLHAVAEGEMGAQTVSNLVVRLLKAGALPDARDNRRATPLHAAVYGRRVAMAALLIHAEAVEFLLERGMAVNLRSHIQYTPLHCVGNAFWTNEVQYIAVGKVLLAHGAGVNARTEAGQTPLHRAATWGRPQVLEFLLAAQTDFQVRDGEGKTALDLAGEGGSSPEVAQGCKACVQRLRQASKVKPTAGAR